MFLLNSRYTRFHLPCNGSLGPQFPTFSIFLKKKNLRYYDPLRLPTILLASLALSLGLRYLVTCIASCSSLTPSLQVDWGCLEFFSPATLFPLFFKEIAGSPKFLGYPFEFMPCSRTTVVSCPLAIAFSRLLPSIRSTMSAFPLSSLSFDHNQLHFRGSVTRPKSLLLSASYIPLLVCMRNLLLSCWLYFA